MKRSVAVLLALTALTGAVIAQEADEDVTFTPFLISFVPMVSAPIGYYDVSMSAAAVGALVRDSNGLMAAGVFNTARDARGLQAAGVFNTIRDVRGFQAAGVFNTAGDVSGGQASGVFNTADKVDGVQFAGVFNTASDFQGVQAAGVFNSARDFKGFQAAYVANFAADLNGTQLAYVYNSARRVRGLQIGLINVATEMDGIQLGLINIARDGVNGFGLTYEPGTRNIQAYAQNGTRYLYTVLAADLPKDDLFQSDERLVVGAGLGTRMGGRHWSPYLDAELLAMGEFKPTYEAIEAQGCEWDSSIADYFRPWPELRLRLGIPLSHALQFVGGYTLDFDFDRSGNLPDYRKTGSSWGSSLFGEHFTAYGHWFLGLKI